MLKVFIKMIT